MKSGGVAGLWSQGCFRAVIKHLCWQTSSGKRQAVAGACATGGAPEASETPRGGQTEKGRQHQKEGGRRESQAPSARQAEPAFPSTPRLSEASCPGALVCHRYRRGRGCSVLELCDAPGAVRVTSIFVCVYNTVSSFPEPPGNVCV